MDKILIVSSATRGGVSAISFTTVIEAPVVVASASFTFNYRIKLKISEYNKTLTGKV